MQVCTKKLCLSCKIKTIDLDSSLLKRCVSGVACDNKGCNNTYNISMCSNGHFTCQHCRTKSEVVHSCNTHPDACVSGSKVFSGVCLFCHISTGKNGYMCCSDTGSHHICNVCIADRRLFKTQTYYTVNTCPLKAAVRCNKWIPASSVAKFRGIGVGETQRKFIGGTIVFWCSNSSTVCLVRVCQNTVDMYSRGPKIMLELSALNGCLCKRISAGNCHKQAVLQTLFHVNPKTILPSLTVKVLK